MCWGNGLLGGTNYTRLHKFQGGAGAYCGGRAAVGGEQRVGEPVRLGNRCGGLGGLLRDFKDGLAGAPFEPRSLRLEWGMVQAAGESNGIECLVARDECESAFPARTQSG